MADEPKHVLLHCPGPNNSGCPDGTYAIVPLLMFADRKRLLRELRQAGWFMAIGQTGGQFVFDPLCRKCTDVVVPGAVELVEQQEKKEAN